MWLVERMKGAPLFCVVKGDRVYACGESEFCFATARRMNEAEANGEPWFEDVARAAFAAAA